MRLAFRPCQQARWKVSHVCNRLAELLAKALGFVEVSDGRISRLHCIIQTDSIPNLPFSGRMLGPATIEDHSANGTFLNGERLPRGERTTLSNMDSISLVLSLSPMVEKTFIFHTGSCIFRFPCQLPERTVSLQGLTWLSSCAIKMQSPAYLAVLPGASWDLKLRLRQICRRSTAPDRSLSKGVGRHFLLQAVCISFRDRRSK